MSAFFNFCPAARIHRAGLRTQKNSIFFLRNPGYKYIIAPMLIELKSQLESLIQESLKDYFASFPNPPVVELDVPSEKAHGDFSTNIALKSAKLFQKSPLAIAPEMKGYIESALTQSPLKDRVERVEVKNPGFINFYLSTTAGIDVLTQVFSQQDNFGGQNIGQHKKIQIEFVSANPRGR